MLRNKAHRGRAIGIAVGIMALVLLLMAGGAGAVPFAYITNDNSNNVSVIGTAVVSPGFISGTVLDIYANRIPGITVIAQNGTDAFSDVTNSNGDYIITIPGDKVNRYYRVTVTLQYGFTGGGVQTLLVTSGNTTFAGNIVLVPSTFPTTKVDVASPTSIPADGMSTTLITATINTNYNGFPGPLRNGVVNSNTTAFVNFYLQNGTLDVTTGNNGTFTGGVLQVLNVPIDNNGQAKVVLKSGLNPGSVKVFNNVTVKDLNGNEVNSLINIPFTSLQGQPDQIYVSVDNSVHQVLDSPVKLANGISTWIVTSQLMKSGVNAGIAGQSITFAVDNPSVATLSSPTAVTDAAGKATVILTSTLNPGTVKVTGSYLTVSNVLLSDYDYARSAGFGQITGFITNENQVQLPGATVSLFKDVFGNGNTFVPAVDINGNLIPSQITSNAGLYAFIGVPSGIYKVNAMLGNKSGFAYPVIVTSGTWTVDVVIVGATLTGSVTRSLSATTVAPGATFVVTITPGSNLAVYPVWSIEETIPSGFRLVSTTAWINSTTATGKQRFYQNGSNAYTYTLVAPTATGTYTISGTFTDGNTNSGTIAPSTVTVFGGTVISIASQNVTPGSSVTIPIVASSITNVAAYTISLTYNHSIVVVDSVTAGALGTPVTSINNAAGVTQMSLFSVTPASGTVILANVVLRAVGTAGQTGPLNLVVTTLSDNNGNNIPNTVINGTFNISSVKKGDVTGDGNVVITDALFIAQYTVGLRTLTPTQLAAGDVNCDGKVDITDALFIAQYTVGLRMTFC